MLLRSGLCAAVLLFVGPQGPALAQTRVITAEHADFASRIAHRCTETETETVPDPAKREDFCICYGAQFAVGLTSEELRTLDLGSEFADQRSKLALAACGAVQFLAPAEQGLAKKVSAGCERLGLESVPAEKRQEFCGCLGEQTVLSLTGDELRVIRAGGERAEAVTREKTQVAITTCGAEVRN